MTRNFYISLSRQVFFALVTLLVILLILTFLS